MTASDRGRAPLRERGVEVILTPLSPSGLLQAAASGGVSFAADRRGGYVFPAFLPAFDAAAALVRLVSLLGAGLEHPWPRSWSHAGHAHRARRGGDAPWSKRAWSCGR